MFEAKFGDYNLEESGCKKMEVANKFIYAFEAHTEWLQFQQKYWGKIIAVYAKYRIISVGSFLFGIIISTITGVIACYIWGELPKMINNFLTK